MKTILAWVKTNIYGSKTYFDVEVKDGATHEEIEKAIKEEMWEYFDYGWGE